MDASFAAPQWRESVLALNWGAVFAPLSQELLWVLESTISDDTMRTECAQDLAQGIAWFGESLVAVCMHDSGRYKSQAPRFMDITTNVTVLMIAQRAFTEHEMAELQEEVLEKQWPCSRFPKEKVLEILELAVMRWYVINQAQGQSDLLLSLQGELGVFYLFPKDKRVSVEKALAFH